MSIRLRKTLIKYSIILGIGLAYLIFVLCTDIKIPCLFYELTGLKCPGCGITRMLVSASKFDFVSAFHYNPFLFITGPFIIALIIYSEVKYVLHGSKESRKLGFFTWALLILALVYGVLRNFLPI